MTVLTTISSVLARFTHDLAIDLGAAIKPMKDGVIADFEAAARRHRVPSEITQVEDFNLLRRISLD